MNVTADELHSYIEAFHQSLESVATQFLPQDYRQELLHIALLPARITGFVSTQFGVAIEYEQASETTIQIVRGSARVEDLFVQAPLRIRGTRPILSIVGANTGLIRLTVADAFPFRLASTAASAYFKNVAFESGPWRRVVQFAEVFGNRKAEYWSRASAESRAKDEVLAAMVEVGRARERHLSISEYIERFKDKTILLLGDYDNEGMDRLIRISTALSSLGYVPLFIKEIPDHPHHDISQKMVAIGAISRFVMIDDSSKSGHILEVQLCKQNNWVTVLLRAHGKGGSWMTAGAAHASNVIHELAYDPSAPEAAVAQAAQWAEAKLKELQRKFEDTYPWRARN